MTIDSRNQVAQWFVPGLPAGQPRARAFARRIGARTVARMYSDKGADGWKRSVAMHGLRLRPAAPITTPISLHLDLWMPLPKSRAGENPGPHVCRPDLDNLVKAVMDALTDDGWWRDDALVWSLAATKQYAAPDAQTGATITVRWVPGKEASRV